MTNIVLLFYLNMKIHPFKIVRGTIADFTGNPVEKDDCFRCFPDGALVIENGYIKDLGNYTDIAFVYPDAVCDDFSGKLITPGFIDTHVHFPQIEIIGSYGAQLLDWLENYTFPAELSFSQPEYCRQMAYLFVNELFRHGTTSCMAYPTVHKHSVDALFEAASSYDMRMFTGKTLMNRNAPQELTDTTAQAEIDCRDLILRWHGKGRNSYVLTPRFSISCDREELEMAAALHREFPDTYIQTHLSENKNEVEQVHALFPECADYLAVYESTGLLTDRTVFGHGIHLSESELSRIAAAGASIAHCPTSNLFLGSGLFDMKQANSFGINTSIATDVGGGTSLSLLRTLGEAYKVQQLNGYPMHVYESFYKITLGAAQILHVDDKVGNFDKGKEADFVVLDYNTPYLQCLRTNYMERNNKWNIESLLFGLQTMGDDRNIAATYVMGQEVYRKRTATN